jgi:hypothetical protein
LAPAPFPIASQQSAAAAWSTAMAIRNPRVDWLEPLRHSRLAPTFNGDGEPAGLSCRFGHSSRLQIEADLRRWNERSQRGVSNGEAMACQPLSLCPGSLSATLRF